MTERRVWWLCVVLVSAVLLGPLLIADVPPLLDYPNHLARMMLLAAGPDDPVLGRFFLPRWSILPNLAGDAVGLVLLNIFPVHTAGRCLLGFILLLNLTGVLALHRALFGKRSFWPLASALAAYNIGFMYGFLNWQIGSGLAMLCAAAWLTWRESQPVATIAGAVAASILLFFCHLMGLVFFLVLIAGAEARAIRDLRSACIRTTGLALVAVAPVLLSAFTTLSGAPAATHWVSPAIKFENAVGPFMNYLWPLDVLTMVLVYGGIALGVAAGWLVVAPRVVLPLIVLPVAYVTAPFDLMSAAFLDVRLSVMLGFVAFAAVAPVRQTAARWRFVAVTIAALFTVRMAVVAEVWMEYRRDLAELRAVIDHVPPASKVYFTDVPRAEAPAYWDAGPRGRELSNTLRADYHLPALLMIRRGAFWPVLFANPAQQPIVLRPEYAALARVAHELPLHARLRANPDLAWPALRDFDFVLMLEAGADPDLTSFLPRCTRLVARSDFAALFRIINDAPACAEGTPTVDK